MTDTAVLHCLEAPVNSAAYWAHLYEPETGAETATGAGARPDSGSEPVPVTIDLTFPARWWRPGELSRVLAEQVA